MAVNSLVNVGKQFFKKEVTPFVEKQVVPFFEKEVFPTVKKGTDDVIKFTEKEIGDAWKNFGKAVKNWGDKELPDMSEKTINKFNTKTGLYDKVSAW